MLLYCTVIFAQRPTEVKSLKCLHPFALCDVIGLLENCRKCSSAHTIRSPVMVTKMMRPVNDFPWLRSVLWQSWLCDKKCKERRLAHKTHATYSKQLSSRTSMEKPPWNQFLGSGGSVVATCFNASSGSLTTNTFASKVCMLLTEGKTTHSVLWKVRYQCGHQA